MAGRLIVYDKKTGVVKDPVHLPLEILKAIDQLDDRVLDLEDDKPSPSIWTIKVLIVLVAADLLLSNYRLFELLGVWK